MGVDVDLVGQGRAVGIGVGADVVVAERGEVPGAARADGV